MTIREIEHFKTVIPHKVNDILNREKIGAGSVMEIKIEIDWNLYHEPIITTTTKSVNTEELTLEAIKECDT